MKQIFGNGRATVLDRMQEYLDERGQHAIAEAEIVRIVTEVLKANLNTTKHLMSDLGWIKQGVKWGGTDYARQIWVEPEYNVQNGKIHGPDGFEEALNEHLRKDYIVE